MTRKLMDSMKCKHCGSEELVYDGADFEGCDRVERSAPQVWTWTCLECHKTSCTLELGEY